MEFAHYGGCMKPRARTEDIVVKDLADESLLFDNRTKKLHSLNRIAAFVWRNCDGKRTPTQIAELIEQQLGMSANEASVGLALEQLSKHKLLETVVPRVTPAVSRQRREMLKLLTSALAIPVITSVTAPHAMAAASPSSGATTVPPTTSAGTTTTGRVTTTEATS
jgi:Coenzyme PQQ synthesis protein D (PqqD)